MKTQNGFTLLENEKDVKNWLNKQKVRSEEHTSELQSR